MEKGNFMEKIVVVANGRFPESEIPLGYLKNADTIICCDGAVQNLVDHGLEPDAIVGDMDSISEELKSRYFTILYPDNDEDCNDLTKAVKYCMQKGYSDFVILGATGLREDHTLGNISLLAEYSEYVSVRMITDKGVFLPVSSGDIIKSFPGQQVSIFSFLKNRRLGSSNLKYPLDNILVNNLWTGTLNECTSEYFSLKFGEGSLIVFLVF